MKKKIKDLTNKKIYKEIYCNGKTSIGDDNCQFCKYKNFSGTTCEIRCSKEYETCIDYKKIIDIVGNEEIEVEDDE